MRHLLRAVRCALLWLLAAPEPVTVNKLAAELGLNEATLRSRIARAEVLGKLRVERQGATVLVDRRKAKKAVGQTVKGSVAVFTIPAEIMPVVADQALRQMGKEDADEPPARGRIVGDEVTPYAEGDE